MIVANNKKTLGGFYNIYKWTMQDNGAMHQERICSFYNWEDVENYFKGYALINNKKVEKQCLKSGSIILSIKE